MKFLVLPLGLLLVLACTQSQQVIDDPSFSTDVQPLLNASCVTCHGSGQQNGNYRVDSRTETIGNGSDSVPNVIAGDADSSKLHQRIDLGKMPPGTPWDAMNVTMVKNWINKGAKDN